MKTRTLGTQGLKVSELGLGCMGKSYSEMLRAFNNGTMVFEKHGTKKIQGKTTIDEVVHSWADSSSQS